MSKTSVVTGIVRFSYVSAFEPSETPSGDLKYSVSILIPKSDTQTVDDVRSAMAAAAEKKFGKKLPKLRMALRDGDEEEDKGPEYRGHYFLNASSKRAPGVVGPDAKPIMNQDDFYSGCYGRADINFFGYAQSGNKGVGCGLNNLMKVKDGDRLDGRMNAEDAFAGFAEDAV